MASRRVRLRRLGYRTQIRYGVAKLLDYGGEPGRLETDANPFAAVVLAHLRTLETREDPPARRRWKTLLVKGLCHRGWSAEDVRQLFRVIDWMMTLPTELEQEFRQELAQYEEERHVPYVTSIERLALEEGLERGREEGLERGRQQGLKDGLLAGIATALETKFGKAGRKLLPRIRAVGDVAALRSLLKAIPSARTPEDIRQRLPQP